MGRWPATSQLWGRSCISLIENRHRRRTFCAVMIEMLRILTDNKLHAFCFKGKGKWCSMQLQRFGIWSYISCLSQEGVVLNEEIVISSAILETSTLNVLCSIKGVLPVFGIDIRASAFFTPPSPMAIPLKEQYLTYHSTRFRSQTVLYCIVLCGALLHTNCRLYLILAFKRFLDRHVNM